MSTAALIVAGGASRRMGRNKLTLALDGDRGRTVLDVVLDVASVVADRTVILLPPEPGTDVLQVVARHPGVIAATDKSWHAGPLRAIAQGWSQAAGCDEVFVTAGDLPGLEATVLRACQATLAAAGTDCDGAAVVREGRLQPLTACYRYKAGQAFVDVASDGEARLQPALDRLRLTELSARESGWPEWWTRPVHTPEDYEAWLRETDAAAVHKEGGGGDEST